MTRDELVDEVHRLRRFLELKGYRRCDIPACNCGSFHGGHANERLREIDEALGLRTQGKTILQAVQELVEEHERVLRIVLWEVHQARPRSWAREAAMRIGRKIRDGLDHPELTDELWRTEVGGDFDLHGRET